ncbi:MAG: ATP-binding protein [bacterium]
MRSRLILYVIALVVFPTAILSMLAAVAVRDREQNIQKQLESAAERTVRTVSQTLMIRLGAVHAEILKTAAGSMAQENVSGWLTVAASIRQTFPPVDQIYIVRLNDSLIYPPSFLNRSGTEEGRQADSTATTAGAAEALARIRSLRSEEEKPEKAVREYEKILAAPDMSFPIMAEATMGVGRCYRDLGEFKLASGAFRQVAGYAGTQGDDMPLANDRVKTDRDADGNIYSLAAMKELTGIYKLAAERDSPAERGRWQRLAVESEIELLERVVPLYCNITLSQRDDLAELIKGARERGERTAPVDRVSTAGGNVPGYERRAAARAKQLTVLLHEQERNLTFVSAEGGAVMDAVTREIGNNGVPARQMWLVIRGTPFTLGPRDGTGSEIVGGFKVDKARLERFVKELADRLATEHGIAVRIEHADRSGAKSRAAGQKDGFLASCSLEWPFNGITLSAYAADPGILMRNTALRLILKEWGILMLALGVLAGAWVVFRHAAAETRRLKERSDYVAGISHDLRTPLASMRMLAESLYLGRVEDPGRQKQFLGTIIGESKRLGHLVERVLFFVRFGENALAYQLRRTDIGDVVRQTVESFSGSLAAETDMPMDFISLTVEPDLPAVMADPVAVGQVVFNLMDNAVKYSKNVAGHGLTPGKVEVLVARDSEGGGIALSVKDNGPGIDKNELKKIFQKFYRVRGSGRESVPGIGLRLALCRHIVHGHGGRIQVESEPGKGSIFTVHLPVIEH